MDFIDPELEQYALDHTWPESEVLTELRRETYTQVLQPRMLSGQLQGRILSMLAKIQRPGRILEIGTYTGYSAICLSEGLTEGGELHTIDINDELAPIFNRYFEKAGIDDKVTAHIGNALDIIPEIAGDFDLVFIDADKENYPKYYEMIMDRMPSGGIIICDNVLWSGKVIEPAEPDDNDTAALQQLNDFIQQDNRVDNVLFPVRDGLMVVRKK